MADMTAATMAIFTPTIWSEEASITLRTNRVAVQTLDHRWEAGLQGAGDRVNIPRFSQNTSPSNRGAGTGTFGTGAATTFSAITETNVALIVNRYYYKADRRAVESGRQVMPVYDRLLQEGRALAIAVQIDADVLSDATNGVASLTTSVGADNIDLTEDDFLTAETNINNAFAYSTDRFCLLSPASRGSALKIESFRNSLYAGAIGNLDGKMGLGYIGQILSFDVYMTGNLAAGTNGKKNAAYQRECIAYAEQLRMQTDMSTNIQDGNFYQFITFMTCGFIKVKDANGVLLLGK